MKDLSVIILSYNTLQLTKNCLHSLTASLEKSQLTGEIIVVDNASTDGSPNMLHEFGEQHDTSKFSVRLFLNNENVGFPKGNNQAIAVAQGKYILLLNSDVVVDNVDFDQLIHYMNEHEKVGGLTVNVVLPTGGIDPASHRGFPTPWNSLTYFLKLEKLFGNIPLINRLVGGYHLTYLDLKTIHEIDAPAAAFYLTRKDILDQLKGFDDDRFFMYGEDIDLTYRTKELGYKIMYYPTYQVTHHKRASGLNNTNPEIKKKTQKHFDEAMKIFYKKHYEKKYPAFLNNLIYFFIDLKTKIS